MKLSVFDRVSGTESVVEGIVESEKVTCGVDDEKTVIFCEFSLVLALIA